MRIKESFDGQLFVGEPVVTAAGARAPECCCGLSTAPAGVFSLFGLSRFPAGAGLFCLI